MPTLSTVTVGTHLDERTHEPSMVSLFLYNAVIWNPHRIHFDESYTTRVEQHPGIVVDGTGGHAFAETLADHNLNVARYRQLQD